MKTDGEELKVRMVCESCGSELVTRDAWAEWDAGTQQWTLGAVFDYAFCHACEGETHIQDVPMDAAQAERGGT